MRNLKILSVTVFIFCIFHSCSNELYELYKKQIDSKEKFILLNINDVKGNVKKDQSIFYIGSDTNYHYFRGYNTIYNLKLP